MNVALPGHTHLILTYSLLLINGFSSFKVIPNFSSVIDFHSSNRDLD